MGVRTLANNLDVSTDEAKELMSQYKRSHPKMVDYCHKLMGQAEELNYCETISGRRRPFEGKFTARSERVAVNTTIQGSAADLVKAATVDLAGAIVDQFGSKKDKPRLIHHVHDELIYECPIDQVETFKQMMKKSMTSCSFVDKFNVKFVVKIRDEKSWDKL